MDPKIPAPLKAYLKKGKATRPKENKMIYPTYKPDQPEIIVVKKNKKRKSKKETGKKESASSKDDIVIHRYKDEYPHIAYIPYSIPQMSLPQQQFPQQQFPQQQAPPQFRENRASDNRAFSQYFQFNMPRQQEQPFPMGNAPIPMPDGEIPMQNMFQREPAPYSLVNQQGVQPLNPLPIEDYQVEQNLPDIPIPVANPVLPEIPLEPVRVERVSGRQRRPDPIPDEPEPNSSERIFDVELDIIPPAVSYMFLPPAPVFEERRAENELLSQQDLDEMFLEQQRRDFEMAKREDIGISPRPPSPPSPLSPDTTIAERIDRRRENPGRPREPLSQEEAQLISDYIEITNTIAPQNRTPEQIDLLNRGRIVYKSKIRNHKEEVETIKKRIEELVVKEGRQYRKKK